MDARLAIAEGLGGGLAALAIGLALGVARWLWVMGRRAAGGTSRTPARRPRVEPPVEGVRVYGDEPPLSRRG